MVESAVDASTAFGASKTLLTPAHREAVFKLVRDQHPTAIFEKLYDDATDGRTLAKFYEKVANKGWTLTIVKAENKRIFGGFTTAEWEPVAYSADGIYKTDPHAFLFSVYNVSDVSKHPITGADKKAIYCGSVSGKQIMFGNGELSITFDPEYYERSMALAGRDSYNLPERSHAPGCPELTGGVA